MSGLFCFLFCAFGVFVLFCVLFLLMYVVVSFLFMYKFTDNCHRVETQLRLITIISHHNNRDSIGLNTLVCVLRIAMEQ